jgi:hypothetical protein
MKKLFENWRKHINEYEDEFREHEYIHGDLAKLVCGNTYTPGAWKCFGIEEFEKVFLGHDDDKKRANIKLIGALPNQKISYNTPDGKYIELPAGDPEARDSDDAFLAAINRWDDYLRAKVDKTIRDEYGSEEEIAALHGTKYNPN